MKLNQQSITLNGHTYTHIDGKGMLWRFEGARPISQLADEVMESSLKEEDEELMETGSTTCRMGCFGQPAFGSSWLDEAERMEVPIGKSCCHCEEEFVEGDAGFRYANGPLAHENCFWRGIFGSVSHQRKECACHVPGATCGDPPGMTPREAANAAVAEWFKKENS